MTSERDPLDMTLRELLTIFASSATNDPDPMLELSGERWPLRAILRAARAGQVRVAQIGNRYYARRSALYGFIEKHPVKSSPPSPTSPTPSEPAEMDHIDRLLAQGGLRRRRGS